MFATGYRESPNNQLNMITIVLIDDHCLFAEGLATMLNQETDLAVVGICTSVQEIEETINSQLPTVVLLDINLNEKENGPQICRKLLQRHPTLSVIAITMYQERRHIVAMKNAGAVGFLPKNVTKAEIVAAIHAVVDGQTYFRGVIERALQSIPIPDQLSAIDLNPQEKRILEKVMLGQTSRQIAEALNISPKTIEFYRGSLFVKFGVKNVVELVNKAQDFYG